MMMSVLRTVLLLILAADFAEAQTFRGPYVGVDLGRQHFIGGSLVDGIDTLQEDSRLVVSVFGGARAQIARVVFGGELGLGLTDGDLSLTDQLRSLTVDYRNGSQWHWALQAGVVAGTKTLVFGYLSEVTRKFDVTITRPGVTTPQQDEQGMLRFGAGVEYRLTGPLHLRVTAGSARADFGDRATNIPIDKRLEVAAGVVVQF